MMWRRRWRWRITSNFAAGLSSTLLLLLFLLTTMAATYPADDDDGTTTAGEPYSYDSEDDDDNFGNSVNYTNYNYYGRGNDSYGKFSDDNHHRGGGGGQNYHDNNTVINDDDNTNDDTSSSHFKELSEFPATARVFMAEIHSQRQRAEPSVYRFNVNRTRFLSWAKRVPKWTEVIVYWMYRDQRIQDNWALIKAQQLALEHKVSLHIVYLRPPKISGDASRHYRMIIEGLKEIQKSCQTLNIGFHYIVGLAPDILPQLIEQHNIGAIVVDFMPLRDHLHWLDKLVTRVGSVVPIIQVDAHNVVPSWISPLQEMESLKMMKYHLDEYNSTYLTEFPPVVKHPYSGNLKARPIQWAEVNKTIPQNQIILPLNNIEAGYVAGMNTLHSFIKNKLKDYHKNRQNPLLDGLSNLSPWLHYGHISAQRCILEVYKFVKSSPLNVESFLNEIFVRRELSDNYCFHHLNYYDKVEGAPLWGQKTLNKHRRDLRKYIYSRIKFEKGLTHNSLWNAAQLQMLKEGKIHRFLRMYWAKKILEWSRTPEAAISTANYLNNKYSIDGRDPNGYVGVLWAMAGLHDRPWKDRPIFGKIRFLSYQRCNIKFETRLFVNKYGAKFYPYVFENSKKNNNVSQNSQLK